MPENRKSAYRIFVVASSLYGYRVDALRFSFIRFVGCRVSLYRISLNLSVYRFYASIPFGFVRFFVLSLIVSSRQCSPLLGRQGSEKPYLVSLSSIIIRYCLVIVKNNLSIIYDFMREFLHIYPLFRRIHSFSFDIIRNSGAPLRAFRTTGPGRYRAIYV